MIVDSHCHVVADNPRYARNLDVGELIGLLDAAGVAKAVLVQSISGHGYDNGNTAGSARRYPGRLAAVGSVDAVAPGAAEALARLVQEDGVSGCRLSPHPWQPDDPRSFAVWEAARTLGIPLLMMRKPALGAVGEVLVRFPEVPLVLDHLGNSGVTGAGAAPALLALAERRNLHLKFSSKTIGDCAKAGLPVRDLLDQLIERFGAERLVWGSNYPASHEPEWPYERCVDAAREAVAHLPEAVGRQLLGGNALRLWPSLA